MNSQTSPESAQNYENQRQKKSLITQSIRLTGTVCIGLASLGFVNSEVQATGTDFVIPIQPSQNKPAPILNSPPPLSKPTKTQSTVKLSPPKISVPPKVQTTNRNTPQATKNRYLDTNSYGTAKTNTPPKTPAVIVSDRNNGCQTVVSKGSMQSGNCSSKKVINNSNPSPITTPRQPSQNVAISNQNYRPQNLNYSPTYRSRTNSSYRNRFVERKVPPQYSHASRIKDIQTNNNTALLFPLSLPARIASTFGWRVHPITGNRRMHYGTDIATPMGTPVLAAYDGKVAVADNLSGYGLTVILRHEEESQESRYAHLSQIFVNPGEWVKQGSVIGLVGSTGFSTGPHLHFEWRHLTQNGWVAVDAGLHLELALDNLITSMEIAQAIDN